VTQDLHRLQHYQAQRGQKRSWKGFLQTHEQCHLWQDDGECVQLEADEAHISGTMGLRTQVHVPSMDEIMENHLPGSTYRNRKGPYKGNPGPPNHCRPGHLGYLHRDYVLHAL